MMMTRAQRQAATDTRLYGEGYRLGWVNARMGLALAEPQRSQMATTPRGSGYIAGHAASIAAKGSK